MLLVVYIKLYFALFHDICNMNESLKFFTVAFNYAIE